ncbi:DUF4269 domain-containing protein [Paenibacillus sp. NPDC056722]|uniref:DUF4269 domain-containing protein n=1 Tax=Paenibacillus sp. NPDC056722 TaxID=3345924 RepID=UPI003676D2CB
MVKEERWLDISYLQQGTALQKEVHALLARLNVMNLLNNYHPVLVGTIPLGIQVEGSDLDIICEVHDLEAFAAQVGLHFGEMDKFSCESRIVAGIPRIKINFTVEGWLVELFGQPRSSREQNGYIHMVVEARVLNILGASFRRQVIELKRQEVKTEPAFARLLQLEGDPYQAMLELYKLPEMELEALCRERFINHSRKIVEESLPNESGDPKSAQKRCAGTAPANGTVDQQAFAAGGSGEET